MNNEKKYIRFIDSSYNTLFYVPDGGSVKVHSSWDGKDRVFPCRYIDSHHVSISGNCYHICQFAEMMEHNGNTYEPVKEIGDLDFYEKKFYDHENYGQNEKPIPYHLLLKQVTGNGTSAEIETNYAFCLSPKEPGRAFCRFIYEPYAHNLSKDFSDSIETLCDDSKICKRINNIVDSIKETLREEASLENLISAAESKGQEQEKDISDNKVVEAERGI